MSLQIIHTEQAPQALGPYSQGIRHGEVILTSGQIALIPGTKNQETEPRAVALRVLENLLAIVTAGGGAKTSIARVEILATPDYDLAAFNEVYAAFFGTHKPARVVSVVAALPAGAKLEASMTAFAV